MNIKNKGSVYINWALYISYFLLLVSIIFSIRAMSSITIVSILVVGVIKNKLDQGVYFTTKKINPFITGCIIYFVLLCISLLYTNDLKEGLKHLQINTALLIIPIAVCCCDFLNNHTRNRLMAAYIITTFIATVYCFIMAFIKYKTNPDISMFFYHELVRPLSFHAILFSILIFIALIFLFGSIRKEVSMVNSRLNYILIIYFTFFLFLLSSKLVIIFYLFYLFHYLFFALKKNIINRRAATIAALLSIIIATSILVTKNPIGSRFREIATGDINLIKQDQFNQGNYFNGLQFRLLEWKYVFEILNESDRWVQGVSAGDAQAKLDSIYLAKHMYTGNPEIGDRGFLGYDTHNQFLQSLLQNGLIGLLLFLFLCYSLIKMIIKERNRELSFTVILLLAYALTESVFETQYGLVYFIFFPLFLYFGNKQEEPSQ